MICPYCQNKCEYNYFNKCAKFYCYCQSINNMCNFFYIYSYGNLPKKSYQFIINNINNIYYFKTLKKWKIYVPTKLRAAPHNAAFDIYPKRFLNPKNALKLIQKIHNKLLKCQAFI